MGGVGWGGGGELGGRGERGLEGVEALCRTIMGESGEMIEGFLQIAGWRGFVNGCNGVNL